MLVRVQLYGSVGHRAAQSDTWSFGTPYPIGGTSYKEIDLFQTVGIEVDESGVTLPSNSDLIIYLFHQYGHGHGAK